MKDGRYESFAEFWPFYVREHNKPLTRALHFIGTTLVMVLLVAAVISQRPLLLLALPLCGYGFAWAAHFFVEHNRPATFTYPAWSLAADFVMWAKIATRQMAREVEKAQR